MKLFYKSFLDRSIAFLLIAIVAYSIWVPLVTLIDPLEFDTAVFIDLVEFFYVTGHPWSPVFLNDSGIVCDLNGCEKFNGRAFQTNFLPTDYTSGLFLLFGTLATYTIIHQLPIELPSSGTVIYAYATFVTICAVGTLTAIALFSRLNLQNIVLLTLGVIAGALVIIPFSGDRIVGEYLSSLLLLIAAIGVYCHFVNSGSAFGIVLVSLVLGLAVETKMSSLFTATFLQFLVYLVGLKLHRSWQLIFYCTIAALAPKVVSLCLVVTHLHFDFQLLNLFLESSSKVARYNASAGLNWGVDRFVPRWKMLAQYDFLLFSAVLSVILLCLHSLWNVFRKNLMGTAIALCTLLLMLSSLAFPIIYKFPYPRLLSQFVVLVPLFLFCSIALFSTERFKAPLSIITLLFMVWAGSQGSIANRALFSEDLARSQTIQKHSDLGLITSELTLPNRLILVDGFFGTPWDLIYQIDIKDKKHIRFVSVHSPAQDSANIFHVSSCRYGWCSKDAIIELSLKTNPPQLLTCELYQSADVYLLRTCKK